MYRLGLVDGAYPEHAEAEGRISIPYLTKLGGVKGFKFRRVGDGESTKYLSSHMPVRLFGTPAFEVAEQLGYIAITEGEFDSIILTVECGIPAVAVPGVDTWKAHKEWRLLFDGFDRVFIFRDNDEPGEKLARRIKDDLDNSIIITPPLKDVNLTYLEYGREFIRNAAGLAA